eukprot:150153-Amphidinium_carterae.1
MKSDRATCGHTLNMQGLQSNGMCVAMVLILRLRGQIQYQGTRKLLTYTFAHLHSMMSLVFVPATYR